MIQIIIITSLTTTTIIGTINIVPKQGFKNNNINKIINITKNKEKNIEKKEEKNIEENIEKNKEKQEDIDIEKNNILAEIYYRKVLLKEKGFIKKKENREKLKQEIKDLEKKLKNLEK